MQNLTLTIDENVASRLEQIARREEVTAETLASVILRSYLEHDARIRRKIEEAVREADAGDFATQEEVDAAIERWRA